MKQKRKRNRRKGSVIFRPDHNYIEEAVYEYLKKGGKINQVEADEKSFQDFASINGGQGADEYLRGL